MNADTLNQSQRESLINILVLGMYSDGHLSLLEDDSLNKFIDSIAWDSGTGRSVFLTDAITRVGNVSSEADLVDYIQSNAASFDSPESRKVALDSLTQFLKVDGTTEAELPFLATVTKVLGS